MPKDVDLSDLMTEPVAKGPGGATPPDVDLSDLMAAPTDVSEVVVTGKKRRKSPGDWLMATERAATRGFIPGGAAAAGAVGGAELGMLGGPFAPFTVPVGAVGGGLLGWWAGKKAQEGVGKLAPGVRQAIGQSPEQVASDQAAYPVSTTIAESAPSMVFGGALNNALTPKGALQTALLPKTPPVTSPKPPTMRDTVNQTRGAADRQGVKLPTTLTSPTGYRASRILPRLVTTGAIEQAEAAAVPTVGIRAADIAAQHSAEPMEGALTPSHVAATALDQTKAAMAKQVDDLRAKYGVLAEGRLTPQNVADSATDAALTTAGESVRDLAAKYGTAAEGRLTPQNVADSATDAATATAGESVRGLAATYKQPSDAASAGQKVQESAAGWAQSLHDQGSALIEKAQGTVDHVKIAPVSTLNYIDKEVTRLNTNPTANRALIGFLSGVKSDLSNVDNPRNLAAMMDLRSSLYRNAPPEGLTAGTKARLAGDLWTNLTEDITGSLNKSAEAGDQAAAEGLDLFTQGTDVWRTRQETLEGPLSRILGARVKTDMSDPSNPVAVADVSPENAIAAINKFAANDRRGLTKVMSTLDAPAQDAVRASLVASFGKNAQGNFDPSLFLSHLNQLSPEVRSTLFDEGMLKNLAQIETALKGVQTAPGDVGSRLEAVLHSGLLNPKLAAKTQASLVQSLGANPQGAFDQNIFLKNLNTLSETQRARLFGPDGAKNLAQLEASLKGLSGSSDDATSRLDAVLQSGLLNPKLAEKTRASLVQSLGANTQGDFDQAIFLKNLNAMPEAQRARLLGPEGAQKIAQIGDLLKTVTGPSEWGAQIDAILKSGVLSKSQNEQTQASLIKSLGEDGAGNFNANLFLKNMYAIPESQRVSLFGRQSAGDLADLETIVRNIGKAEPRAHGYGAFAAEMLIPTLLGMHGGLGDFGGASVGVLGINGAAAHFLAKPDTLKWVARLAAAPARGAEAVDNAVLALRKAALYNHSLQPLAEAVDSAVISAKALPGAMAMGRRSATSAALGASQVAPTAFAEEAEQEAKDSKQAHPDAPLFDPSTLSDEELNALIGGDAPAPAVEGPVSESDGVTLDPAAYRPKALDALRQAVVQQESGGDATAVSPKGAEGLFQAMPATQHDPGFGVRPVTDGSLEEKNRVGGDYLDAMLQKYGGDQVLALMGHNWGPAKVDKWVKGGMKGKVPKETRDYVESILGG